MSEDFNPVLKIEAFCYVNSSVSKWLITNLGIGLHPCQTLRASSTMIMSRTFISLKMKSDEQLPLTTLSADLSSSQCYPCLERLV